MKIKLLVFLLCFSSNSLFAVQFRYTYQLGDQYRFLSTVTTEGFFDENNITRTEILNRIAFSVDNVEGTSGHLIGTVHTSERTPGDTNATLWRADYPADFWRDERGNYTVEPQYFMPMVRNVPFFPAEDVAVGRKWIASGQEVHDIRQLTGNRTPFRIPFSAYYEYVGPVEKEGKIYHLIKASYSYKSNFPTTLGTRKDQNVPLKIASSFDQDIYWDEEIGQPAWYTEEYVTQILFSNGDIYTTRGHADAHLIEAKPMDKDQIQKDLKQQMAELGIDDVKVAEADKGVTLIMDNIKFKPNSAEFLPGETTKIDKIGQILSLYPDRDIQISGHTAKAGNEKEAQTLSERRALAVANYLINKKYKTKEHLVIEGHGSKKPIADNGNTQGMAQNRRVEITILEN